MKSLICIVCPTGCSLKVFRQEEEWMVEGGLCSRGKEFAVKEMTNPARTLSSTVRTIYPQMSRLSVRTDGEIPLNLLFKVMAEIKKVVINQPVKSGEIIIKDVLGTGVNIISTSDLSVVQEGER